MSMHPCWHLLIHTCHAATQSFPDSAMSFVKARVVDGNIGTSSLLLVKTFMELRVAAGRSRMRAGRPHAVSGRPMLIHTHTIHFSCRCHIALCSGLKRSLSERHGRGMTGERHGMCESNTAALCKSNGKPLAETAWEPHGVFELAFTVPCWSPLWATGAILPKLIWLRKTFMASYVNTAFPNDGHVKL
jgi:hypothetical protein